MADSSQARTLSVPEAMQVSYNALIIKEPAKASSCRVDVQLNNSVSEEPEKLAKELKRARFCDEFKAWGSSTLSVSLGLSYADQHARSHHADIK